MELPQVLRHTGPVLTVGHAEPPVLGMEHGNGHAPRLHLLAHHQRQQALRLHRVIRQPPEEVLKIGPQRREDRGHETPEVHGDHRIRGQVRVGVQIRQVPVGIELDLQRLLNGIQLSVLDLA